MIDRWRFSERSLVDCWLGKPELRQIDIMVGGWLDKRKMKYRQKDGQKDCQIADEQIERRLSDRRRTDREKDKEIIWINN